MQSAIQAIKEEWTDRAVVVDGTRAEYRRFVGKTGKVVTVNENRRALVDFGDGPWYDIPLECLQFAPPPVSATDSNLG